MLSYTHTGVSNPKVFANKHKIKRVMATILDTKTPLKVFKEGPSVESGISRKMIEQECTGTEKMGRKTMVRENHSLIEQAFNHKWDG